MTNGSNTHTHTHLRTKSVTLLLTGCRWVKPRTLFAPRSYPDIVMCNTENSLTEQQKNCLAYLYYTQSQIQCTLVIPSLLLITSASNRIALLPTKCSFRNTQSHRNPVSCCRQQSVKVSNQAQAGGAQPPGQWPVFAIQTHVTVPCAVPNCSFFQIFSSHMNMFRTKHCELQHNICSGAAATLSH